MVQVPDRPDPTLDAVNAYMESVQDQYPPSGNIGFGEIGKCERYIWSKVNAVLPEKYTHETLRIFRGGHSDESLMASDLRRVEGITLYTHDPSRGENKQYKYDFLDGRLTGRLDGVIVGLLQSPETPHIWEHKAVNELKFKKLHKAKTEFGEKDALREWDATYFAQAQMNMLGAELDRHYLTVSTPGVRQVISCRTELNKDVALALIEKAKRILSAKQPPECTCESWSKFKCEV